MGNIGIGELSRVEETSWGVGADDAYGLEVGVDYGGAYEFHAAALEVLGDLGGKRRVGGAYFVEDVAAGPVPEVGGEGAKFLLDDFEGSCVGDGGLDFAPVADDGGILAKFLDFVVCVIAYSIYIKVIKRSVEGLALVEHALPT